MKDHDTSPKSGKKPTAKEPNLLPAAEDHGLQDAQLITLVYGELRALAHEYLKGEWKTRPLQTTALVHEAYLRLAEHDVKFRDRTHFIALAATTMRRVLVDLARERASHKRGANAIHLSLEDVRIGMPEKIPDVLLLDQLMHRLAEIDPRKARAIELRVFGGLSLDETARALGISRPTVERDLRFAKAWLGRELRGSEKEA